MLKEGLKHNLKLICIIFATVALISAGVFVALQFSKEDAREELNIKVHFLMANSMTQIDFYKNEDGYYLFLPSFADLSSATVKLNDGYTVKIGDKIYSDGDNLEGISGDTLMVMYDETEISSNHFYILKAENTGSIHINTKSGSMDYVHKNKENKEAADMLYLTANGEIKYNGALEYIKGRGNMSFNTPKKKPYNIKLLEATDMLGMGKSKKWALISNYFDQSGLRNKLVYDFGKAAGLAFSPDCDLVDVYLNGQYAGAYLLTERVGVGEGRVEIFDLEKATEGINKVPMSSVNAITEENCKYYDIGSNPSDITGGYILELEFTNRYQTESSWFITDRGLAVVIASPEFVSKEQMEYVRTLFQEFEDAVYEENGINPQTGKSWNEYIDVNSWAEKYLIDEIFTNQDTEWSSQYLYLNKGEPKFYSGIVWDYDFSIGNGDSCLKNPETLVATWRGEAFDNFSHVLPKLLEKEEFQTKVKQIYAEKMQPLLAEYIEKIDEYEKRYEASFRMNEIRWNNGQTVAKTDTLYMKEYLVSHIGFLDSLWIEGKDYAFVCFATSIPQNTAYLYAVEKGEVLGDAPIHVTVEGDEFLGWFIEETGEKYSSDMIITEDIRIIGKWKSQEE